MPKSKTDHKVYFKFLTKEDYMGRFALRASSENYHTNYHYSEEVGNKNGTIRGDV